MQSALVVAAVVLAANSAPPRVAMPGLSVIGFEERLASFYGEHLAQQLKFEGLDVVTNKEIATLLGFERQKALLGCSDASNSCMAELANALGADCVVLGDIAKVGSRTQMNLKVISASNGKTLAAYSDRVEGEEALLDALSRAAEKMASAVATALNRTIVPVALDLRGNASAPAGKSLWWVPVVGGAAVAGAGAALFISGNADHARLESATPENPLGLTEAQTLRDGGKLKEGIAIGCLVGGGAAIALGVILFGVTRGAEKAPAVAIVPFSSGGAIVVSGVLP